MLNRIDIKKRFVFFKILLLVPMFIWIIYNFQSKYFFMYLVTILYLSMMELLSHHLYRNIKRIQERSEKPDKKLFVKFTIVESHAFAILVNSVFLFENNIFSMKAKLLSTFISVLVITILLYSLLYSLIVKKHLNS